MITLVKGGLVVDPTPSTEGPANPPVIRDVAFANGRIIATEAMDWPDTVVDATGSIVMAAGIDIHSHIAGGKVGLGRLLMPEDHRDSGFGARAKGVAPGLRSGGGVATPTSFATGYAYAGLGYGTAIEPAMVPSNARACHLETADLPIIDKGCYVMLGNDEFLLDLLAGGAEQRVITDYVGWMITATAALGVKTVNPAGVSAFKFNQRSLGLEQPGPRHGVTPRAVIRALTRAVHDLGVPHPLHVHCNNLGVPGNIDTTLATIDAAEGLPIHLTHAQFHAYGTEGDRKFSSAAARLAEAVNRHPNVSLDVGQIMFGQTVTASGDTMAQFRNRRLASPDKWICMDIECDGGCGLVPFRYRDQNFVNALQWAIGLELFLLIEDPWRVFLTTDHPNGAPFTTYPDLIRLLMDRPYREACLAGISKPAQRATILGTLKREYSLEEIVILTRAAPARILGLGDRGRLTPGAAADVCVYSAEGSVDARFAAPRHVFKDGVEVARSGAILETPGGVTHVVRPAYDRAIEARVRRWFDDHMSVAFDHFVLGEEELEAAGVRRVVHPCREPTR